MNAKQKRIIKIREMFREEYDGYVSDILMVVTDAYEFLSEGCWFENSKGTVGFIDAVNGVGSLISIDEECDESDGWLMDNVVAPSVQDINKVLDFLNTMLSIPVKKFINEMTQQKIKKAIEVLEKVKKIR